MTNREFKEKKKALWDSHRKEHEKLDMEFVLTHENITIGDLITDREGTIKVEKIETVCGITTLPLGIYYGACYTAKGVSFKNGAKRSVLGANVGTITKP